MKMKAMPMAARNERMMGLDIGWFRRTRRWKSNRRCIHKTGDARADSSFNFFFVAGSAIQIAVSNTFRLGVLGSGKGSNFVALAEALAAGKIPAEVGVVLSDVAGAGISMAQRIMDLSDGSQILVGNTVVVMATQASVARRNCLAMNESFRVGVIGFFV